MLCELVTKNSIYKSLRSDEEIDMTNGSFISTCIKTGIVLQFMTTNKNQIEGNIIILKSSYTRRSFQIILYKRKRIVFQDIHVTY